MLRVNYDKYGSSSFVMRQIVFKGWTRGELEEAWKIATSGVEMDVQSPDFLINVVVQGHLLEVVCNAILWKSTCVPFIKRVRGKRDRWIVNANRYIQASFIKREPLYNHYKV